MELRKTNQSSLFWYALLALLLILTALLLRCAFDRWFNIRETALPVSAPAIRTVLIDAGHGGSDGGAVSVTGTAEKTLNLETALTLASLLRLQGYRVILTRDSDVELRAEGGGTRKMQDLKGRLLLSEANPAVPFISIHMNKFPQERYHGLQVYYSRNNPDSRTLADAVQNAVKTALQPDNNRETKPATSAIFLLDRITAPAVLIECGFLSNREEAVQLEDPDYRLVLCLAVSVAYGRWEADR